MINLQNAFELLDRSLAGLPVRSESVPVRQAVGRVLCEDQTSRLDLPPFDKSAMDGYAVLQGDEREEYRVLETVAAGSLAKLTLEPGTAVKVMTGAPVPAGTGAVIMIEHTRQKGGAIQVLRKTGAMNICRKAEDVRRGDRILSAGSRMGPLEIANLIACGLTHVPVARRLRVAVFSTGDEIVDDPGDLTGAKIMNSNGPMLSALVEQQGLEIAIETSLRDDPQIILEAIREALARVDLVLLSGGVSAGDFDYVLDSMPKAGLQVHFSRLAVKPGKPTVFATRGQRAVFGLPGNPVSVFLMFHLLVKRAITLMNGLRPELRLIKLPLGASFSRRMSDRHQFVPARLTPEGRAQAIEFHGSAHLTALQDADGFFMVPIGVERLEVGHEVDFLPIGRGLR